MRAVVLPLVGLLSLLVCGCVSTSIPPTYLQLSAGGVEPGAQPAPRVLVGAVKLPDFMLRDELLLRLDEYELNYDGSYRWAEPLDLGVQRVIAYRLSAALDSYGVVSYPSAPLGGIDWRIDITLRRFEASGARALIVADAFLLRQDSGSVETLRFEAERPLRERTGSGIAAILSQLLADFVDALEQQLRSGEASTDPP